MNKSTRKNAKQNTPTQTQHPAFLPISMLSTITHMVDGELADTRQARREIEWVAQQTGCIDDETIGPFIAAYEEGLDNCRMKHDQLRAWQAVPDLTGDQRLEVERLLGENEKLREETEGVLDLGRQIQKQTINRILEKDPAELAIEGLLGQHDEVLNEIPRSDLSPSFLEQAFPPKPPDNRGRPPVSGIDVIGEIASHYQPDALPSPLQRAKAALELHDFVQEARRKGYSGDFLLAHPEMLNRMAQFKGVVDGANEDELDTLCARFSGFHDFARKIEGLGEAIQDGRAQVP